ncbi:MAG TPA: hypothetical protein VLQ45_08255 [Thermoanaerobaculia bacterium]|nr:hypothetical protein [Thermoanaerobaculia bacterium]HSN88659.1 hypothetical protein [Thermoanaerobaculia bacterium]
MYFLGIAAGLVSLVCWIMVLIKMFPAEGALKGVLAIICGLYAFVWGWMNATRFNLKTIMLIWTVAILISVIANFAFGGMAAMQGLPE